MDRKTDRHTYIKTNKLSMYEGRAVGQKHTEEQVDGQDVIECESEIERK